MSGESSSNAQALDRGEPQAWVAALASEALASEAQASEAATAGSGAPGGESGDQELTGELASRFSALAHSQRFEVLGAARTRCIQLGRETPKLGLALAELLVELAGDSPDLAAQAMRARAVAAHLGGTQFEARRDFERAKQLHAEAGETLEVAIVDRSLVEVCHLLGENAAALEHAEQARGHFTREGQRGLLAELEVNVGNVFVRRGMGPEASQHYARARELFEAEGQATGLAFCDFNLGLLALRARRFDVAQEMFADARKGMAAAGFEIHVVDCDYHDALIRLQQGDWRTGLRGLEEARERYREVGKPSGPGLCALDLAQAYLTLGALDDAFDQARSARELFEPLGFEFEQAQAQLIEARVLAERGDLLGATEGFELARKRFLAQDNLAGACYARLMSALVELDGPGAVPTPEELDGLGEELERHEQAFLVDLARLAGARAAARSAGPDAARERLLAAFPPPEASQPPAAGTQGAAARHKATQHPLLCTEAWVRLGDVAPKGDPLALAALGAAVRWTESSTGELPDRELRTAFLSARRRAHDELALRLAEAGGEQLSNAVKVLARGRGLNRREAEVRLDEGADLRDARVRLEGLASARLAAEVGLEPKGPSGAVPGPEELDQARAEYLRLRREQRGATDWLGADDLDPLQGLAPGAELWAYVGSRRGLHLMRCTNESGWSLERLDTDLETVGAELDRLEHHRSRSQRRGFSPSIGRAMDAVLERLGELLMPRAFQASPTETPRQVHIVPVGELHRVPFGALRRAGVALVESADCGVHSDFHEVFAAEADWDAGRKALWVGRDARGLEHAEAELAELEQRSSLKGQRVGLEQALEVLATGGRWDWVHLAMHGSSQLAGTTLVGLGDGERFLLAEELQGLRASVGVAFLGACDSGRLPEGGTTGIGLRQAFLRAGARCVVSSLWPLEDRAAAEFGLGYHYEMLGGKTAGAALAGLQRGWAQEGRPVSDWGPWQVAGRVMFKMA